MPLIQISIAEGRTDEQLRALLTSVHNAVHESLGAPEASIRVLINQVDPKLWLSGGQTLHEKATNTK